MRGRGIVLDRDATLIDVVRDEESGKISVAFHPSHVRLLPGVVEGLRLLKDAGYVFGIATNQPGPAKGEFSRQAVEKTNLALIDLLAAEDIIIGSVRSCLHHPTGGPGGDASLIGPCACRKPLPGLLEAVVADLDIESTHSWMIGDSSADIEAGFAARLRTGLVFARNRCELCPLRRGPDATPTQPSVSGATLEEVARAILATSS